MSRRRARLAALRAKSAWSAALIATHLCACTTLPPPLPPVSEAQRNRMGGVGIVSLAGAPPGELAVGTRGTGAGAAEGAARGAAGGAVSVPAMMLPGCAGMGAVICIVLIPIAAVGGAVYGAVVAAKEAVPEGKATEMEARLNAVLAEVGQQERLRGEVVGAATRAGIQRVSEITAITASVGGGSADYRKLADAKVDTVLEVGLVSVSLAGRGGADPVLAFRVSAVARLVDAKTNAELFRSRAFTHASAPQRYSEWAVDGLRPMKDELARAYRSLADEIVDEIFLVVRTN